MSSSPGIKEMQLRALREDRAKRTKAKKPLTSDLRAKIKVVPRKIGKPGR